MYKYMIVESLNFEGALGGWVLIRLLTFNHNHNITDDEGSHHDTLLMCLKFPDIHPRLRGRDFLVMGLFVISVLCLLSQ